MKKALLTLGTALLVLVPLSVPAMARGVVIGPGFYGGWYAPYWGPYWGRYWGPGYMYGYPYVGQVKLDTKIKDAQVFLDGSYAGTTHENKTMRLRPGSYNLEIRERGHTQFVQRIYVAAGKTLHLHPEL